MAKRFFLGVVGSRERCSKEDYKLIEDRIFSFYDIHERNLILVSGGCPEGGDRFAEDIARTYGIPILIFYPDKQNDPDTGNPKRDYGILCYNRNTEIAKRSTVLIALTSKNSKGTNHTISEFEKYRRGQELIIL
jgi:hypothetical protein